MGGVSTSHSAVLRNGKAQSSSGFDLHSWQGLTYVLKVGKESLRDPLAYAEFRNLVLQYAQQGGDIELRKQIDAVTATFKKEGGTAAPVVIQKAEPQKIVEAVIPEKKVEPIPTPVVVKATVAPVEKPQSLPVLSARIGVRRTPPVFHSVSTPAPTVAKDTVIPEKKVPIPVPIVATPPVIVPKVTVAEVVVPPKPVPQPTASAPAQFKTVEEYKARIAEIKRLVNTQIGNPVALIDTHNNDGRTYMTALLGALKATGGNGTEGVEGAMAKLEEAYATLTKNTDNRKDTIVTPPIVQTAPEKKTEPPVVEVKKEIPVTPAPPSPAVAKPPVAPPPVLERRNVPVVPQIPRPVANVISTKKYSVADTLSTLLETNRNTVQKIRTETQAVKQTAPITQPVPPTQEVPQQNIETVVKMTVAPKSEQAFKENKYTLKEVAKVQEKETLKKVIGVDTGEVAVKQTELSAPHITEALNQLLHEWTIFSGSGFFGTGPGGEEHPLYRKLSSLSMGEVTAGRWDGADPKITKTIKQYVDAWRHEQGVAYTINETFEHYLRRVVQRILKRQNP